MPTRPFALIRTQDQWLRVSHSNTTLEGEVVRLYWRDEQTNGDDQPFTEPAAGLAFDGHCRVYHSVPNEGRVERLMWGARNPLQASRQLVTVLQVDGPGKLVLLNAGADQGMSDGAQFIIYESGPEHSQQADKRIAFARIVQLGASGSWAELTMSRQEPIAAGMKVVLVDPTTHPLPVDLFQTEIDETLGDFIPLAAKPTGLDQPRAVAVDQDERLFIAEAGARRILIYDLWSNRLLRQVQLAAEPVDLVAHGRKVYALLASPPGLIELSARSGLRTLAWPMEITAPARFALSPKGELFILEHAGTVQARIVKYNDPQEVVPVAFATDLDFQTGDPTLAHSCTGQNYVLVVARRQGEDFVRFCVGENKPAGLPPLTARGYDGLGIVRVPDGRIGFWSAGSFRHAVAARLRYLPNGSVTTFRLDSGEFHTIWGRLFLDACIPKDTQIVVRCVTADEPPDEATPLPSPPANTGAVAPHVDLSPPLPPPSLARQLKNAAAQSLHRRETGCELPWVRPAEDDAFETYEAPVIAEPGRYLWVLIELSGNTRATPRLKSLRAEYPTHDYLRRLPQTFSRDEGVASFLGRYLATFEGQFGELEAKADARATLLDPRSAPAEILPWLASFLGLMLDERMARAPRPGQRIEDVRRVLIAEATWLFRFRGTVPGLRRFVELYLGVETILIEKFRLRGLGAALLSDAAGLSSNSILGAGFRVGGAIGEDETQLLSGSIADAFETHAHRFALIIPASVTSEQLDVVKQILELHRPAHTLVEVCTVAAGMRVGRGLHVELTSIIGRSGGFTQLQLGSATLGRGSILGRPDAGTVIGGSRLGEDSRVG
jgi:phage tail-like protein